eukprot:scaffold1630_cov298-Prasinococcus_capsulatus_cf.AAC.7
MGASFPEVSSAEAVPTTTTTTTTTTTATSATAPPPRLEHAAEARTAAQLQSDGSSSSGSSSASGRRPSLPHARLLALARLLPSRQPPPCPPPQAMRLRIACGRWWREASAAEEWLRRMKGSLADGQQGHRHAHAYARPRRPRPPARGRPRATSPTIKIIPGAPFV